MPADGNSNSDPTKQKRKQVRVSQADVPAYSLVQALRVAEAISENYGGAPTKPLDVAHAMNLTPASSNFRQITGASIAYGLTEGGYNAPEIKLTPLSREILSPTEEGMELDAKRKAFLLPRVINEFLRKYDGHALPRDDIAQNVLTGMGVPRERVSDVFKVILDGASTLGLVRDIKGKLYGRLDGPPVNGAVQPQDVTIEREDCSQGTLEGARSASADRTAATDIPSVQQDRLRKVFITHGKNKAFVDPIRKLLVFGEMEAIVSVERQSVSEPVPDKVMNDMRSCGAAIIHVESERKLINADANEHVVLNPNVLIEIGAAMALYGRRFILLVRDGVRLPSNLQGLYEVRYSGEILNMRRDDLPLGSDQTAKRARADLIDKLTAQTSYT